MAIIEMKVPSPGESITEVQISRWLKKDGDYVEKDEEICEIDSDKATLTLNAEESGVIKLIAKEGETISVGSSVCSIDTSAAVPEKKETQNKEEPQKAVQVNQKSGATEKTNGAAVNEKVIDKKEKLYEGNSFYCCRKNNAGERIEC